MRALKCFIACAFGREDVDEIYSKSILKVLKELKITALRVDKINHNKNIDSKIIELIEQCDFCIADLTFARPSVYYEAGYVHGLRKEVVFTVRKDHLKPTNEDHNKIHFDLITKNIIDWTNSSKTFENRLRKRIELVIRPIKIKLNENETQKENEYRFSLLSTFEKLNQIKTISEGFIKKNGFLVNYANLYLSDSAFFATKIKSPKNNIHYFAFTDSITQTFLRELIYVYLPADISKIFPTTDGINLKKNTFEITIIIFSLTPCPDSRVQKALKHFEKESDKKEYSYTNISSSGITKNFRLYIFDKIKSIEEVEVIVRNI